MDVLPVVHGRSSMLDEAGRCVVDGWPITG
jgi:hypothetical protein